MNTSSASLSASESTGFFGAYGGQFVPDDLKARLDEVTEAFDRYSDNSFFKDELDYYFKHYTGRPNPIFFCANLSERLGGAKIYLKREDLNHLGAHKINNTLGQCLLAKRMGKKRRPARGSMAWRRRRRRPCSGWSAPCTWVPRT